MVFGAYEEPFIIRCCQRVFVQIAAPACGKVSTWIPWCDHSSAKILAKNREGSACEPPECA
jgi:hypothetical protein